MTVPKVKIAFEMEPVSIPLRNLLPTKTLPKTLSRQQKYQQVVASVREVGIIEPIVIHPEQKEKERRGKPKDPSGEIYMILDGHLRVLALKELGKKSAPCLISTDDEGYTYNRILNRLCSIQEHVMIMKALDNGVSEERLAQVLKVDPQKIRAKRNLLNGLCPEAVELLKSKPITAKALRFFKQVKPMRQIEMAELMVSAANYTAPYARALVLASRREHLLEAEKVKSSSDISPADIERMEKEMQNLQVSMSQIRETYGENVLHLTVTCNYLNKLLDNARVVRFLSKHQPEILSEFQKIVEAEKLDG